MEEVFNKIKRICNEDALPEGTIVFYKNGDYDIKGEIVGISGNALPVLGITYIIKIIEKSGNIDYNYSCMALPRVMLRLNKCERCLGIGYLNFDTENGWHDKCPDCIK